MGIFPVYQQKLHQALWKTLHWKHFLDNIMLLQIIKPVFHRHLLTWDLAVIKARHFSNFELEQETVTCGFMSAVIFFSLRIYSHRQTSKI